MNGGYAGTSKRMVPNKLPGSGKPVEFIGYWKSLRTCSKCGKKMWENGEQTRCICELRENIEKKEKKAMPKTLKERVIELYKSEFTKFDDISFAADEISARIGGTSSTVVQSIIREETGIKPKKLELKHNFRHIEKGKPGRKSSYTAEDLQVIVDMYKAGSSDNQIGAEIGRSAGTVSVKLSALRKKGLIGLRHSHKKPEKVSQEKPAPKTPADTETPAAGTVEKKPLDLSQVIHPAEPEQMPEQMPEKEIGNIRVILIQKPTLGQFIDLAAKYGYELGFFSMQEGRKEITFREVE